MGCCLVFDWLKPKQEINNFDKALLASNLVGAKTLHELHQKEEILSNIRQVELRANPINGNFDYQHFKEINKYLFQDIFVWAGMDRYDIGYKGVFQKGNSKFTHGEKLPEVSKVLFAALKDEKYFKELHKEDFVKSAASFMNGLNILHPFREGNGRTQRLFMEQLAKNAGYNLDLSNVSKSITIQAAIQGGKGNIKGYEILLENNI